MNHLAYTPRLSQEGIAFSVVVDSVRRDCLITTQALHGLRTFKSDDPDADVMEIFKAFEAKITGVARRLVAAGVAGSPLVMRPETFNPPRTR
ncbi:MAG TPA: DUF1488 family protein [Noviherbaspirillum sp.]